jgi:hypothetical protein
MKNKSAKHKRSKNICLGYFWKLRSESAKTTVALYHRELEDLHATPESALEDFNSYRASLSRYRRLRSNIKPEIVGVFLNFMRSK